MLEILRRGAQTWVAKIFFILLVGSFGIWGISRSLVASTPDAVITVGDQQINTREFRLAYERQISTASRQFGTRLTAEQARAFGLDRQVYAQLAAGAALDQLSGKMKLGLSETRLAELIAQEPAFKSPSGQFDRQMFSAALRNAGLREDDYIASQSKAAIRSQIVDAISDGFKAPKILVDALTEYKNQTRDIRYMLISASNIEPVKAPTNDILTKWFETKKAGYRAPEYRKFSYLKLEPSDIIDLATVADADVTADYEKNKDRYLTQGTRTIEQLTFADKAKADDAASRLKSGAVTFDSLITETGKKPSDVLLGDFSEKTVPDPKIAKDAFAIEKDGGVSDVVAGSFGPVILRATKIVADHQKTFDEVKDTIRKDIALSRAADDILNVHDRYEDIRASGATLEEAAKQLKLKATTIDAIDATGKDMKGNPVDGLPEAQKLVGEVFKTEVGVDALPLNIGQDGYVWFDVLNVIPDRDRTLDEVREKATADWTAEQTSDAIKAKTDDILKQLQAGAKIDDIAAKLGIAVEEKTGLKRQSQDAVLSSRAISAAFGGPLGHVANAWTEDKSEEILLVVSGAGTDTASDVLSDDSKQIQQLANATGDDILDQMVTKLQDSYGVSINQTLAQQAMSR
jgi:peptidyl-prolyl cis-trans isomerase D